MILLIIICVLLSGIAVWQRIEIIAMKYNIDNCVDKMITQVEREHNGMVSYDLLLKRLLQIKTEIHGRKKSGEKNP